MQPACSAVAATLLAGTLSASLSAIDPMQICCTRLRRQPDPEAGLTLVECLVSLTMVTLVGLLIGPPLLIAGATQQHTRRVYQAQAIAQGEIDQLRADQAAAMALPAATVALTQPPPPKALAGLRSSNPRCHRDAAITQPTQGVGIDLDGDAGCDPEFILQALRNAEPPTEVLVRVYGVMGKASQLTDLQTEIAPLRLSSQISSRRPLAVVRATLGPQAPAPLACYHRRCAP